MSSQSLPPVGRVLAFLILAALAPASRAADAATAKLVPALGWDIKKQGGFPVSLASGTAGDIWVGTEGNGLWKYHGADQSWTQYTTKDGLGDDCVYALAFDRLGRLWAGHLNHGVSVYNGAAWKNYGLLDGPIGDRVFAIAVSPKDGDVWIATDMGLARYAEERQDWDYYTRASGLPSDQIQSVAFDEQGQIYAGTQCSGIAIAGPGDDYSKWRVAIASGPPPRAAIGKGLVSNMINLVYPVPSSEPSAENISVMTVLTPDGASATSDGSQWAFLRSKDWHTHGGLPSMAGLLDEAGVYNVTLPAEDWMTSVAVAEPDLWLGYRKSGVEERDLQEPTIRKLIANVPSPGSVIIRAMLVLPDEPPLFAAYDGAAGGLLTVDNAPPFKPTDSHGANAAPPKLPAPAPIPAPGDEKPLVARLNKSNAQLQPGEAFYLADDWRTEGDWVGRYGNSDAKLCGMAQDGDQDYPRQSGYQISVSLGPHHEASAAGPARHHDDDASDDRRSLYDPTLGHRRDAEVNDLSDDAKTYPDSYDGPDLWVKVTVPENVHCLSLYFQNNDAHTGYSKFRDYDVQVLSDDPDASKVQNSTPLARARVTDFWGGVYKQFLVCGPASYVVRIGRNRSWETKLQAVFLDQVTGLAENRSDLPGFDLAPYTEPEPPKTLNPTPLTAAAVDLWGQLDDALAVRGAISLQLPFRIWSYRAATAGQAPAALLEYWRWEIGIWMPEDRTKFDAAMKAAHGAIKK